MSLSFVSKTVQTTTEGGDFVEEAIAGSADDTAETSTIHKPLFEQLRDNQEQADAEREEYQKAMMRGTLALDEEDVAHLESLQRKQREQQDAVNRKTEEDLAAFRAARAERSMTTDSALNDPKVTPAASRPSSLPPEKIKLVAPQIRIKRKRRMEDGTSDDPQKSKAKESEDAHKVVSNVNTARIQSCSPAEVKGSTLGSLLTGYGSSSSDED
jgi:hypothetical protein